MFVDLLEDECIYVIQPGVTLSTATRAIDEGRVLDICAETVCQGDLSSMESYRFWILWQSEKYTSGRSRWRELKRRGGEVDPEWLEEDCTFGYDNVLPSPPSVSST